MESRKFLSSGYRAPVKGASFKRALFGLPKTVGVLAALTSLSSSAFAQSTPGEVLKLREEIQQLKEQERRTQAVLKSLEGRLNSLSPENEPKKAIEEAINQTQKTLPSPEGPAIQSANNQGGEPQVRGGQQPSLGPVRLTDLSLNTLFAAGWSSANDEELDSLQGGGHDPKRRGFTLQQAELSIGAAVDPYLRSEAHFVFTEGEGVETEEAFITSTRLPYDLEVEAGFFLTEFGSLNPSHPHVWDWIDQPVINTRMFGADGMSGGGVRVGYRLPTPWHSEVSFGAQHSGGDNMYSFRSGTAGHDHGESGRALARGGEEHDHGDHHGEEHTSGHSEDGGEVAEIHGGDHTAEEHLEEDAEHLAAEGGEVHEDDHHEDDHHEDDHHGEGAAKGGEGVGNTEIAETSTTSLTDLVYLARMNNFFDLSETTGMRFGVSSLFGPNTTGRDTFVYGADLLLKWTPVDAFRGYPFVKFEGEVIGREFGSYRVDGEIEERGGEETLRDLGFYSQLLYGFTYGWAAGVRGEYASGDGESVGGSANDPFRDNRFRLSPLVSYRPSEFSRLRLQYNYDAASHLEESDEHSVWLGVDVLIGTHPAHAWGKR